MKIRVPFLQPCITKSDIQRVVKVMESGWLVLGPETKKFEETFAKYMGTKYAVLTNSCTCSLDLCCDIAGIGPGDEVITTPLTYTSSATPILRRGATAVFVDVDPETGLIDLKNIEKAITKKTKAILPVHLYGQMADMKGLHTLAKKHKLVIIEDAAHAIEAQRDGLRPGQGTIGACFSFHTAKNITAGQGGAIATDNKKVAEEASILRRDGVINVGTKRRTVMLGYKYLSTELDAALLHNQMLRIDKQWAVRKKLYERYTKVLDSLGLHYNHVIKGSKHGYHMLVLWVDPAVRDKWLEGFADDGIQVSVHYDPLHLEPYFVKTFGYKKGDFPVAERLGLGTITLPMHPLMTKTQQDLVIQTIKKLEKKIGH